jgi:uncharacterized membrane protein YagU involved in acid resistance
MIYFPILQLIQDAINWVKRNIWNHKYSKIEMIGLVLIILLEFGIVFEIIYFRYL